MKENIDVAVGEKVLIQISHTVDMLQDTLENKFPNKHLICAELTSNWTFKKLKLKPYIEEN